MYRELEQKIGFHFADKHLLTLALTHASCGVENYERLEFLGDALLDFVVGESLYLAHPDWSEGKLTVERAACVANERLSQVFERFALRGYITAVNLAAKPSKKMCANFVESLVAAIYLDANGGLGEVKRFVNDFVIERDNDAFDYISAVLHEFSVNFPKGKINKAVSVGDVHHPRFAVTVELDGVTIGTGESTSKKDAAKIACKEAWSHLRQEE